MSHPDRIQKRLFVIFILSSAFVVITGTILGIRLFIMAHNQTTATVQSANNVADGFPMSGRPAPDFNLTDQFGRPVTLSSQRGHEVVLAFIDSRCKSLCPLTAEIMYAARTHLGASAANHIALIAVNANPIANSITEVQDWSINHGMLHQWLFLTGPAKQLQSIYHQYNLYDQVSTGGAVVHDPAMLIIDATGHERLYFETLDASQSDIGSQEHGLEAGMRQWLPQS